MIFDELPVGAYFTHDNTSFFQKIKKRHDVLVSIHPDYNTYEYSCLHILGTTFSYLKHCWTHPKSPVIQITEEQLNELKAQNL